MAKFQRWLVLYEDFEDKISNIKYTINTKYNIVKSTDTAFYHTLNSIPFNKKLNGKLFQAYEKDDQDHIYKIY